jgi:hypothetical protein
VWPRLANPYRLGLVPPQVSERLDHDQRMRDAEGIWEAP